MKNPHTPEKPNHVAMNLAKKKVQYFVLKFEICLIYSVKRISVFEINSIAQIYSQT